MSGATLGTDAGGTLGTDAGFTLGTVPSEYLIDNQRATGLMAERVTYGQLTLRFRVTTDVLVDRLRPLKANEGQVDRLVTDAGGYTAVDRADGANTFELSPPPRRQPLRRQMDVHVARYEEDLVSQAVDEWTVEVDLVPASNRGDTPSISQSPAADEWGLTTRFGQIATSSIDADFLGTGADGVERFELTGRLSFDQAHVFEAALNKLDGVRVRQIQDGANLAVDDTSGGDNTLTIASPTTSVLADGDYVVTAWTSERINDGFQGFSAEIAAT